MLHAGFDAGLQSDSDAFGTHAGLAAVIARSSATKQSSSCFFALDGFAALAMTDDGDDQVKDSNDV
jgi:hypothetical protein